MITQHVNDKDNGYIFSYSYYDYGKPITLEGEYQRYKYYNKLKTLYSTIYPEKDISLLFIYNISLNQNKTDPILSLIDLEVIKDVPDLSYLQVSEPEKIIMMNEKINKYLSKLKTNNNNNKLTLQKITNSDKKKYTLSIISDPDTTAVTIDISIYVKVANRYREGLSKDRRLYVWAALLRYKYLNLLTGVQGAVMEHELLQLNKTYGVNFELFGSIINTTLKYYCSLFYDIERYFGSVGNFFNLNIKKGFYEMNPPFIIWYMEQCFKILEQFLKLDTQITIFITIPVWYISDRIILNKFCGTKKLTDYEDLKLEPLKKSEYLIVDRLYCQDDYSYTDYVQKGKPVHFSQTNVLVVSNVMKTIDLDFLPKKFISVI